MSSITLHDCIVRAQERYGARHEEFAKHLGWTTGHAAKFLKGTVKAPMSLCADAPRLAVVIGMDRASIVAALVDAVCPDRSRVIGRLILATMCERGCDEQKMRRESGLSEARFRSYLKGRPMDRIGVAALAPWLRLSEEALRDQQADAYHRKNMPTVDLQALPKAQPLCELLHEDFDRHGLHAYEWAAKHHVKARLVHALARGMRPMLEAAMVAKLAAILSTDPEYIRAGLRLNQPLPEGRAPLIQQRLLSRMGKSTLSKASADSGLHIATLSSIAKHADITGLNVGTVRKLSQYLELSFTDFCELAKKAAKGGGSGSKSRTRHRTMEPVQEAQEVIFLRLIRKASASVRAKVLEVLKEGDV
jgi:hypothetical protein